jgi:hypothetical protein
VPWWELKGAERSKVVPRKRDHFGSPCPWLTFNPDTLKFEGEFADEANKLDAEEYRTGLELPKIG